MNIATLKTAVTSKVGLKVLAGQKHSPKILFGAGVVGMVGTVVLASRATLKLDDVLDEFEAKKDLAKQVKSEHPERYTDAMSKSDNLVIHTHLALDVVKLYAPAIGLGVLSIGALAGSHVILSKRNAGLIAAYTSLDKAFNEYRGRVIKDVGEDKDNEYMFGFVERDVHVGETKKGEPKIEKIRTYGDGRSPYAVVFDASNPNFQNTPEYNIFFLRMVQNHLNDRLRAKGHVFLNDAYRELGMEDTEEGAVTGWLWDRETGDGYIDFGIWTDRNLEGIKDFRRGPEGSYLLDFNVDGAIYKNLKKKD